MGESWARKTAADNSDAERYAFELQLAVKHPTLAPEAITELLSVQPTHSWAAGTLHVWSPNKDSRLRSDSYWTTSQRIEGARYFFDAAVAFIRAFDRIDELCQLVNSTGGRIYISIQLRGKANIGDLMRRDHLEFFIQKGIDIGVEVFPGLD